MKHFYSLALAALLLPALALAQDSAEDRYIPIFDKIVQADALSNASNVRDALPVYKEAREALAKLQADFPAWNPKLVKFRLNYLDSKINPVESVAEPSSPAETAPSPKPQTKTTTESDDQVRALQAQLRQVQLEKKDLESQLKQVAADNSAGASAETGQALDEARDRVAALLKENQRLKADAAKQSPDSARNEAALIERATQALVDARAKLAEQTKTAVALTEQNRNLQKRLEAITSETSSSGQLAILQKDLRQAEAEKSAFQTQLREAQAKTSTGAGQLSQAEEKIKNLQKENNLLRASLEQRSSTTIRTADTFEAEQNKQAVADLNRKIEEQAAVIARLVRDKDDLQKQLDKASNADALVKELASSKQALKKLQRKHEIQTEAAVVLIAEYKMKVRTQAKAAEAMTKQLEDYKRQLAGKGENAELLAKLRTENDDLKKQIADLQEKVAAAAAAPVETGGELSALQGKVTALQAQLDVLNAKPVPYTEEELNLLKPGGNALAAADSGKNASRGLTPSAADLVAEAQRLFAAHKLKEAEDKYQQVLKSNPNNVFTLANLATIQIERENFEDAEKNLRKAMKVDPKDAFTLGVWGNMLFRIAKYDEAVETLSQAAQLDPKSAEIQNILGISLSHKGQRRAAETALRKALELDPNYGNAHNNLAVIYITQDPPLIELAKWHYQKGLSLGVARNPDLERLLDAGASPDKK